MSLLWIPKLLFFHFYLMLTCETHRTERDAAMFSLWLRVQICKKELILAPCLAVYSAARGCRIQRRSTPTKGNPGARRHLYDGGNASQFSVSSSFHTRVQPEKEFTDRRRHSCLQSAERH